MFEIKKPSSSNKTVRMPDELIERLEKLAAQNDISFNQLVIQRCEYALKDIGRKADDTGEEKK
ncbi:MAG: Arc family DNA-binding protein [Ruminococcus sp.]|nr:Arc family DNA-binding protein [Ruminococcus sp.]